MIRTDDPTSSFHAGEGRGTSAHDDGKAGDAASFQEATHTRPEETGFPGPDRTSRGQSPAHRPGLALRVQEDAARELTRV